MSQADPPPSSPEPAAPAPAAGAPGPVTAAAGLPSQKPLVRRLRIALLAIVLLLIGAAIWYAAHTGRGWQLINDPSSQDVRRNARAWIRAHRTIAPLAFVAAYALIGGLCLPVWWLQVLAGFCFGVAAAGHGEGANPPLAAMEIFLSILRPVVLCLIGATLAAMLCVVISRFIFADWFERRVESRLAKLQSFSRTMGNNGFLVVMLARAMHLMPFGLSNYAFGVMRISMVNIAIGTFLGSIPAISIYVMLGHDARLVKTGTFILCQVVMHIVLLVPIILRYLRPEWFKRIGVE